MNFELTPQQKAVQQSARQFAQTVLQETVLKMMQQDVSQKKHIRKWEKWDLSGFHFQKNMVVREEIIYPMY